MPNLINHTKNYTKDFASRYNLKVAANINDVVDPHALQNRDPISAFQFKIFFSQKFCFFKILLSS